MKRENKFKCWDKKLKKWVDIFTCKIGVQLTDVGFAMSTGWDSEDNPTWDFSKVEFDRYEFPQFTGLLDKSGKEIYEGDIVNRLMYPPDANGNYNSIPVFIKDSQIEVSFDEGCFIGKPSFHLWRYICCYNDTTKTDYEVIGNIYENPDLL
ncbi:MAG: YopX family protein [Bacteroidales bacterium]